MRPAESAERELSQEDMISYGFSVRHWQMIEAGRPSTLFTLLRICEAFDIQPEQLVAGLSASARKSDGRRNSAFTSLPLHQLDAQLTTDSVCRAR